jgi:PEP-CTERM motif-containing protein
MPGFHCIFTMIRTSNPLVRAEGTAKTSFLSAALLAMFALVGPTPGSAQTLTFEGLADSESIADFYNGGSGGLGSGPGYAFGITFSPNTLALIDSDAGGTGLFANEPSSRTVFTYTGSSAILNMAGGFTDVTLRYASSINGPFSLEVFTGLDGSGTKLLTAGLASLGYSLQGDPTGREFGVWTSFQSLLSGEETARSIVISGPGQIMIDNVTLTPVPEPSSILLLGLGLVALAWARRRTAGRTR